MSKFVCTICGYIYDEAQGYADNNIAPGTSWDDVPSDWKCPICTAPKSLFNLVDEPKSIDDTPSNEEVSLSLPEEVSYTNGELSAIFSNLAKGWEKQYRVEVASLCTELSSYYMEKTVSIEEVNINKLVDLLNNDLQDHFSQANQVAIKEADRGSLRALKWSEQVSKMTSSHLDNLVNDSKAIADSSIVAVCEICGFIYIGEELPNVCPVCKVPNNKMTLIERRA